MWALVVDDTVIAVNLTDPSEGWAEVTPTPRPMDTVDHTWEVGVEIVDGVPTEVWNARDWRDGELTDDYREVLIRTDAIAEYSEQVPGAIEAFRVAKEKAALDVADRESAASLRPANMSALQADVLAWEPSGVTADDLVALQGFLTQIIACRYWTWGAMRAGEVYGRALWGIAPAE